MDEREQARAYACADFEEPHSMLIDRLLDTHASLPASGVALDLGCGPADIAIRFAQRCPGWSVDGVDGAEAMLAFGRDAVSRVGLGDRVRLHRAYLPDDPLPREHYDFVFSNSLLHHLADPATLWTSVARHALPGTPVFVMDLMRPDTRATAARFVDEYAAGEPDVLRHDFFHSLLAAYRPDEVAEQLRVAGLDGLAVEAVSDRHLVVSGTR